MNRLITFFLVCVVLIGGMYMIKPNISGQTAILTPGEIENLGSTINEITIKAENYEYSPNTITINKGERVKITINNVDSVYGISIPDLGIDGTDSAEFIANQPGEFDFYCISSCGESHKDMKGKLIVE